MVELWRLTRNRYGRTVYDALARAGVTATWMHEYVASLSDPPDRPSPSAFDVGVVDPELVASLDAPTGELRPGEAVVAAVDGETPLGYLFLSVDAEHEIHPLERSLAFDGAYVRRVFVAPDHRQRGVASALLATACRRAADRGAGRATALVARDNRPSRALFEKHGFRIVRDRRYARVGPFSYRSVRER